MRKITIILGVTALLVSCGDKGGKPETELDKITETAKDIVENGASSPLNFNEGLLGEITLLDVKFRELDDMDAMDTTVNAIEASAKASIEEAENVIKSIEKMESVGIGADHFKDAGLDLAKAFKEYAEGYREIADVLAVPDSKWTLEQLDRWGAFDSIYYTKYVEVGDRFNEEQLNYFDLNGLTAGETVDAGKIYEESKEAASENK